MVNTTGLAFPVTAGRTYRFECFVVFRTAATTTGLKLGLTCPAFSVLAAHANIPIALDGTAAMLHGTLSSSGDSVVGTGIGVVNTDHLAVINGLFVPTANGTVQVQHASEVSGSAVTVRAGSVLQYQEIP
jgi:hypothetical protein